MTGLTALVETHVREDERQFVYLVDVSPGYCIMESAELWERPIEGDAGATYFFYPTVFDRQIFANVSDAQRVMRRRYPWIIGS